jgi:hypothetical protein
MLDAFLSLIPLGDAVARPRGTHNSVRELRVDWKNQERGNNSIIVSPIALPIRLNQMALPR